MLFKNTKHYLRRGRTSEAFQRKKSESGVITQTLLISVKFAHGLGFQNISKFDSVEVRELFMVILLIME